MATDTHQRFAVLWEEALREYRATSGKDLAVSSLTKPTSLESLLLEVGKEQERFSEFKKKKAILFHCLRNALVPIDLLGQWAAGGVSNVRAYEWHRTDLSTSLTSGRLLQRARWSLEQSLTS